MLSRLHTLGADLPIHYTPAWSEAMTESAIAVLADAATDALAAHLHDVRQRYPHLFAPECLISADPNRANWGLRASGDLVLFDWERLTRAHPAIDLGITV